MRTLGVTYIGSDYAFPRVHVDCNFMLAITHDDLIEIDVLLTRLGRSSIGFEFRTFKDGNLAAKGSVVIVCMDRKTQRAVSIPDELRGKLAAACYESAEMASIGE